MLSPASGIPFPGISGPSRTLSDAPRTRAGPPTWLAPFSSQSLRSVGARLSRRRRETSPDSVADNHEIDEDPSVGLSAHGEPATAFIDMHVLSLLVHAYDSVSGTDGRVKIPWRSARRTQRPPRVGPLSILFATGPSNPWATRVSHATCTRPLREEENPKPADAKETFKAVKIPKTA